ncbi:MAG: glycosyltransferase [Nitrososphaeraceae archaeon]
MTFSFLIPTYNESGNIIELIEAIKRYTPKQFLTEIVVIDDGSPDGTGKVVENYKRNQHECNEKCSLKLICRNAKSGLVSAILTGIENSSGDHIIVMDADFSHPPEVIPKIIDELMRDPNIIVVASRYIQGGSVRGWTYKRKLVSNIATGITRLFLGLGSVSDPLSGFFAFPRHVIPKIKFQTKGYKILLELLVKSDDIQVKEVPYIFRDRKHGKSKMDYRVVYDYLKSFWILYRYGRKTKSHLLTGEANRKSILFLSKAGRFFTVGAGGLVINYTVSYTLSTGILSTLWYIQATFIGILISITSNFFFNKAWTFEDTDFSPRHTIKQYSLYLGISSMNAVAQLSLLFLLMEFTNLDYALSLILAVAISSVSNFLVNKKWTFGEKIWE